MGISQNRDKIIKEPTKSEAEDLDQGLSVYIALKSI